MGKRWALAVAAAVMLCFSVAQATPATPYDPGLLLWYPSLTAEQQAIFDLCYTAAVQGQETVPLPAGSSYDDACVAMDALLRDCPELCWLSRYYAVRYYQQTPDVATQVTLRFTGTADETAHLEAARVLAENAGMADPWERALAIHDALCQAVVYQYGARANDAYGALVEGQAVCDGYAGAYALACRLAGIRCGVITGTAVNASGTQENHAWNLVDFGDAAMLVDVTWDDQDSLGRIEHSYFGLTDTWAAADHREESVLERPACQDISLNWHVRRGMAVEAMDASALQSWWEEKLAMLRDGDASTVEIRFLDADTFAEFLTHQEAWLEEFNGRMGPQGLYGRWSTLVTQSQGVFSITMLTD